MKCSNCNGMGGFYTRKIYKTTVTREMAIDAGCPEMEGNEIGWGEDFEIYPCEVCDGKGEVESCDTQLITPLTSGS